MSKLFQLIFIVPIIIGAIIKGFFGRGFLSVFFYLLIFGLIITAVPSYSIVGTVLRAYFLFGMFYVFMIDWRDKEVNNNGDMGKAVFSTMGDLKREGLRGNGIVLGKLNGQLIEKPSSKEGHTLILGGTGTGKTRGHGIPTLLRWNGTGLAVDIKGELSQKTAHTKPSIVFSTESRLARYNPLQHVREIEDVQDIGRNMFPKPEKGEPFWSQCAQSIFAAACWEYRHRKTFSEVAQFLCGEKNEDIINTLMDSRETETRILINTVSNLKTETLGTVFAELRGKLTTIAIDKNIQYATSGSDFSPEDIENNMIYLQVSEHRLKQYGELFTVIVSQFLRYLTKREERKNPPILIMLDEFPRLGKMSEIVGGLATLRSRNVHLMLIIQSLAQLDHIYGKEERKIIVDNCGYKLVLNATDTDTQKYFSDMAGQKTAIIKSISQTEGYRREQSTTTQETTVPLIRPEEFGVLEKPILFPYRMRPIELDRAFWDKDVEMRRMVEGSKVV